MEQKTIVSKRAQDSAECKVGVLEAKIEDSNSELAEVISVVSARDKEFANLKGEMKQVE